MRKGEKSMSENKPPWTQSLSQVQSKQRGKTYSKRFKKNRETIYNYWEAGSDCMCHAAEGKRWARGTSTLHFLLCYNWVPSLLQNPIWSSLYLSSPLSSNSTEALFSPGTPHSASSTLVILRSFLLVEVILIPCLPKAVGPGPHLSWPLSITGSRWEAFGVTHISLSPVFAPPSERSISDPFYLPFPYTTVEFNIQHHSPYFFSLYCVYLAVVSHDSFQDDFKTFNSCSRPHL